MIELLNLIPKPVAIAVASMSIGGVAVFGAESRYVKTSEWERTYILQIKAEIREIRKAIRDEQDPRYADALQDDLHALIDELCVIAPDDRECRE